MTTSDILNALIGGTKMMLEIIGSQKSRDDLDILNNGITGLYDYIVGNSQDASFYSRTDFAELFYSAIADGEDIPNDVCIRAERYFKNFKCDADYSQSLNNIKDRIIKLRAAKAIHDMFVAQNEEETAEVHSLIFNFCHLPGSVGIVSPLYQWAVRNARLDCLFLSAIFEYGYIMGKRAERAKKKKHSNVNK